MDYKVGDTVVHWTYGVGSVAAIEEIQMAGMNRWYYVIEIKTLKLWVAVEDASSGSLRFPVDSTQFRNLFEILQTPSQEPLSDRYFQRKTDLHNRMQKRTLEGLCHVIRDLKDRSRAHSLSWEDAAVLNSAQESLLDEWVISLGTERSKAFREMEVLLQ